MSSLNGSTHEWLLKTGVLTGPDGHVVNGIQVNTNVAFQRVETPSTGVPMLPLVREAELCDFDCTLENGGQFHCPAARSDNPGIIGGLKGLAPEPVILEGLQTVVKGLRLWAGHYADHVLPGYYERYRIPPEVASAITAVHRAPKFEVNLFGANPELLNGILWLADQLMQDDLRVNITTVGRRLKRSPEFREEFLKTSPHILAMSVDHFTIKELTEIVALDLDDLEARWRAEPSGQGKKAISAIWVLKWAKDHPELKTQILINMVLHKKNIWDAKEIWKFLEEVFPFAIVNPYPVQTAFEGGRGVFDESELPVVEEVLWEGVERTLQGKKVVRRVHYLLKLLSVFRTYPKDPQRVSDMICGHELWQCWQPGALQYVQVGKSPTVIPAGSQQYPGLHMGCFWNPFTVTQKEQISSVSQVFDYLNGGYASLVSMLEKACTGCGYPRLGFYLPSVEQGMNRDLLPAYFPLRLGVLRF